MNEIISNDFVRLNETIPFSLTWEEIDDVYESPDPPETIFSKVCEIGVVKFALKEETTVTSIFMDLCTNIMRIRDPTAFESPEAFSADINWESLISLAKDLKDKFLSLIHGLAGLALLNPADKAYHKLSLAACSTYLLSLTIGGATGYEVFQEKIVQQVLSVFDLVAKVQKKSQSHSNFQLWIQFTNFVDYLKLAFKSCSLSSSPELKDLILQKVFDFHDYNFQNGYSNKYALTVHRSLFEILDIFMHPRHGELESTAMDLLKWTLDFHRYSLEPRKIGFHVPHSHDVVEHISQWFIKAIDKYPVTVDVLHTYIKFVVQIPDKDWRPEHIKQALEYAAKYDSEIYKKANKSIISFLDEDIIEGSTDVTVQTRAIELLGYMAQHKSHVEWVQSIESISKIPREIEIIRILIDTFLEINPSIHTKALQSLQTIGSNPNTNAGKILIELISNCKYEDKSADLPFECPIPEDVLDESVPSYSFAGHDILTEHIQELPQRVYNILYTKAAHSKRVALCFIEFLVKLNKMIIYKTDFCKELSRLKSDPSLIVTRQAMQTIDSILSTFPNCYPVVWTWCELYTSILNNPEEKNNALAREYFIRKVLDNIRNFDGNKAAEHLLSWEIVKTMISITSRLYFQSNISRLMTPNMVSDALITMVTSHLDHKNKYLALVVLNLICPISTTKNLDALINLAFSQHLLYFTDERVILLALELFTSCIHKFSDQSLNHLFNEIIILLESGRIFHSNIGKALNLLQHIHVHFHGSKRNPRQIDKWADDLYMHLESKLLKWVPVFPENLHTFIPCFTTYVLLNCERTDYIHPDLKRLVQKQLLMCSQCMESKMDKHEELIYTTFIKIAGVLSFKSTNDAAKNCSLFVAILKNCERYPIVQNLMAVYADISKKHGRIYDIFLCAITQKFESPDVKNRIAAFECVERLIREEHLLLKGNLMYRIVYVMLDSDKELSEKVSRFFFEFAYKKNPRFFQVCLRDIPLDLNGYNEVQPGMSYEKVETGLFGEENRSKRYQIYEQFVPLEGDVFLCMYFGKLSEINSNFSDAAKMKTPEAKGMVKDVCFILKLICKEDFNEKMLIESTNPEGEKTDNVKQSKPTSKKGGRNKELILADVLDDLSTHLDAIYKIAQFYSDEEESLEKIIEELSLSVFQRFPEFIKLMLNSENLTIKNYWTKIQNIHKAQTASQERPSRNRRESTCSSSSDEILIPKKASSNSNNNEKENSDIEMDVGMKTPPRASTSNKGKSQDSDMEVDFELISSPKSTMKSPQKSKPSTSKKSSEEKTRSSSKKTGSTRSPRKTPQKSKARRILSDSSSDEDSVIKTPPRTPRSTRKSRIPSDDDSNFEDEPLFSTFDKIKLRK